MDAVKYNDELMPLITTESYLTAFIRVHIGYNPLLSVVPQVSSSNFVHAVGELWDFHVSTQGDLPYLDIKRHIVIGAARRICQVPLIMDQQRDESFVLTAQRRGLLFQTRDVPSSHQLAVARYDSGDAWNRFEALECLTLMANLFASVGAELTGLSHQYCHEPYERSVLQKSDGRGGQMPKLPNPNRRSCGDLAYLAYNFRVCANVKDGLSAPLRLLQDVDNRGKVDTFTAEDFRDTAQLTDNKNPLQVTLSYIAGKFLQLKALGEDVSHLNPSLCVEALNASEHRKITCTTHYTDVKSNDARRPSSLYPQFFYS